jgi:hypothetical protein
MARNCPSDMTSTRRLFILVRSMATIQACEYSSEQMITTQLPTASTDLPNVKMRTPDRVLITVRRYLVRATPIRTGMVATPVAESPARSLMSGSVEAMNVQENVNRNTSKVAVPGIDAVINTGKSDAESAHDMETTRFFITGISFNRRYLHDRGRMGTL